MSEEYKPWKFCLEKIFKWIDNKYDEKLLKNFYLNKGYYNVEINSSFAKVTDDQSFELIFNINANQNYFWGTKIDLQMIFQNLIMMKL